MGKPACSMQFAAFILLVAFTAAFAPSFALMHEGKPIVSQQLGHIPITFLGVPMGIILEISYIPITFLGVVIFALLWHDVNRRSSDLQQGLIVVLYLASPEKLRSALAHMFESLLDPIVLPASMISTQSSRKVVDIHDDHELRMKFLKARNLEKVGDSQAPVAFKTLGVNKFLLLRQILYTLVMMESVRKQMVMFGEVLGLTFFSVDCILHVLRDEINAEFILSATVVIVLSLTILAQLQAAVTMNDIMSDSSLMFLQAWKFEVQQIHWALQGWYKEKLCTGRVLLDNYFRGLLQPYDSVTAHITTTEKPVEFFGVPVTSGVRNRFLLSALSGTSYLLYKLIIERLT